MVRRKFLESLALGVGTVPFTVAATRMGGQRKLGDLTFASVREAALAISRRRISSVELTKLTFERIRRYGPQINAFTYLLEESALAEAKQADARVAKRAKLSPLHGVPIHVKEAFGVRGQPCTWGLDEFKNSKADDSDAVRKLRDAGAVLIGGTNVPEGCADCQAFNPIYGTTNNPWDLTRTPGGSSGGSAAALAAGFGHLSVGSDMAGSIRVPSHFCGTYGHKPSLDLISENGHSPGGKLGSPGFTTLIGVCGPMSRSAQDLEDALGILGGPIGAEAKAWSWKLPAARHSSLKDFRIGYVVDDPSAPITTASRAVLENVIGTVSRLCAQTKAGWPPNLRINELLDDFWYLVDAFMSGTKSPDLQEKEKADGLRKGYIPHGYRPFVEWQAQNLRRLDFRALWQSYFSEIDVFLMPVTTSEAFPHDHRDWKDRTVPTFSPPGSYEDLFTWPAAASLTGCPATAAPVGLTKQGLPVGLQIIGPYWEDATPIRFAELLAREVGGFVPPPRFEAS